jgi:hypothetical protein
MAIKSQTASLSVSSASAATKTITGITSANPCVVSSTAHGYLQGQIVTITGVVGMPQINPVGGVGVFVVDTPAANTFNLKGVDGTSFGTYVSGGLASLQTMVPVGAVTNLTGFDGQSSEIDVTNLQSTAKEFLVGLQDFGNVTLAIFLVSDTGQLRLRTIKTTAAIAAFTIGLSDGSVAAFAALVKQFSFDAGGPDSAVKGSVTLRVTGAPAWFA